MTDENTLLKRQVTALKTCLEVERGFKEWVGLTDEERSYYLQSAANVGWWQASLFIEAKLKEKNT